MPTQAQLLQCYILSCWVTRFYLPINLIRLDERSQNIFMLIGEDIEIEIKPSGEWLTKSEVRSQKSEVIFVTGI
ncbi:MAG: hypothetical protein F6K15_23400 [Okeania sp. SIO2B3]|nr:hypothetical protein [Okeania sp. SIO2B3]